MKRKWIFYLLCAMLLVGAYHLVQALSADPGLVRTEDPAAVTDEIKLTSIKKNLLVNYQYQLKEIIEPASGVSLKEPDQFVVFEKTGKQSIAVNITDNGETKKVLFEAIVVAPIEPEMHEEPRVLLEFAERVYFLGDPVEPDAGIFDYVRYTVQGETTTRTSYPVEHVGELPDFSKIGTYYLQYLLELDDQYYLLKAPVYIVYPSKQEDNNFPADALDEFLATFLDTNQHYYKSSSEIDSDARALDGALVMIMTKGLYTLEEDVFVISQELIQELAWTYFNRKLPDGYCDWLTYDEERNSCENGFQFCFVGGDGPGNELSYHFRTIDEEDGYLVVRYLVKYETPAFDGEPGYYVYQRVTLKVLYDAGTYRLISFEYTNPADE